MHTTSVFLGLLSLPTIILAAGTAHHNNNNFGPRQASPSPTSPSEGDFSANVAQLISLYVPSSVTPVLYSAYTREAVAAEETSAVATNAAAVIESAFTASTPPDWLDDVPREFRSNIRALESAVGELREGEGASTTSGSASASGGGTRTTTGTGQEEETDVGVVVDPPRESPDFDWGTTDAEGSVRATSVPVVGLGVFGVVGAVLAL